MEHNILVEIFNIFFNLNGCSDDHTQSGGVDPVSAQAEYAARAIENDNTAPIITGPNKHVGTPNSAISISENDTAVFVFSANKPVTWSIVDLNNNLADASKFTIDSSTGALSFTENSAPDYENPTQSGDIDNDYVIIVQATDAKGNSAQQTVTVTVVNVDEIPPLITGPSGGAGASTSTKSINENTTAVHTFAANEPVTWSIVDLADASEFTIDSSTGALSFNSAPDYEYLGGFNQSVRGYVVVVRATDSVGNTSDQSVHVIPYKAL